MIISLMKILPCKEYVEYFLDGKLYCNTVRYFRDKGYDEFEGAAFLHPTTLRIGSHTVPEEDLVGPAIEQQPVQEALGVGAGGLVLGSLRPADVLKERPVGLG